MGNRFHFSLRVTLIGGILIIAMLGMSRWQWNRHLQKIELITELAQRLEQPVTVVRDGWANLLDSPEQLYFKKLHISGEFDFAHEILIKNRRYENTPGMLLITPLKITGSEIRVLVNRGFIPLSKPYENHRHEFEIAAHSSFIGIVKEPSYRKFLAPLDPPTSQDPWQREFLRIDISHLAAQFPYPLAPFYLELMEPATNDEIQKAFVKSSSDKEEMLLLPLRAMKEKQDSSTTISDFPVPFYTTVIPPNRHLGYVFEWAAMAGMTFLICLVLQLRRPRHSRRRVQ